MDPISHSIQYLQSTNATASIEADAYWPKWDSPWWHMSALFEMGMADRIPKGTAEKLLSELSRTLLPYFFRDQPPLGKLPYQDAPCPCSLGNIYQLLSATGLDVDAALPWARKWFLDHQMPDGGLNCDEDAYRGDPGASSIVGTIAPLEAILMTRLHYTPEEETFLDRGARCLIDRELRLGSRSEHNAEERDDEEDWLMLCFPRFYFYDVLRGLTFTLHWSDRRNQPVPRRSIAYVIKHLETAYPDGEIQLGRLSYEGIRTQSRQFARDWRPASRFPLLEHVSHVGQVSLYLTQRWREARELLTALESRGLIRD